MSTSETIEKPDISTRNPGQIGGHMTRMEQQQLFSVATFNTARSLKEAMRLAADGCGLSREDIVHRMNALADRYGLRLTKGNGQGLTLETLEKWINVNDLNRQPPAKALPVFCAVTGSTAPFDALVAPLGRRVIGPDEEKRLRWAEAKWEIKRQTQKIRKIEAALG